MIFEGVLRPIITQKFRHQFLWELLDLKKIHFLEYIEENFNQYHYADLFIQQISS